MRPLIIQWLDLGDGEVRYLLDGVVAGPGDQGFDVILDFLRQHPDRQVMIRSNSASLGGQSLEENTPFAHRYGELVEVLGERSLAWSLL